MYLAIVTIPLVASMIPAMIGHKVGVGGSYTLVLISLAIGNGMAALALLEVAISGSPVYISACTWLASELTVVSWSFRFDSLTVLMLVPVLMVSMMVHLYSVGYLKGDPHQQRFFSYLSLFTFFMVLLISANDILVMFVGWEGVGICSYLLISFWYTRVMATKSALLAIGLNRIGDWILLISMFTMVWAYGTLDFTSMMGLYQLICPDLITIIGITLLIGAIAKSSQVGLHTWLPEAMEGPTPVSALLHAATMVVAGVYLVLRLSPLLEFTPTTLMAMAWIGSITALLASTIGVFQNDLKKVIAYSTTSQLGLLFLSCGLSQYSVALFHTINHAFFKSLLFLSAGTVIHSTRGEQDLRRFGGLLTALPLSYVALLIGSLSLVAIPYLSGFWSKEAILISAYGQHSPLGTVLYWMALISAFFTAVYSTRLLVMAFWGKAHGYSLHLGALHHPEVTMEIPLVILALLSIGSGFFGKELLLGAGSPVLASTLHMQAGTEGFGEIEVGLMGVLPHTSPMIVTVIATLLTTCLNLEGLPHWWPQRSLLISSPVMSLYSFMGLSTGWPLLMSRLYGLSAISGFYLMISWDRGILERLGPHGISLVLSRTSRSTIGIDSGFLPHYLIYGLLGVLLLIAIAAVGSRGLMGDLMALSFMSLFTLVI